LVCVRGTTGVISAASEDLKGANVTRGITPIWFDNKINRLFAIHQLKSDSIQRKIQEKTYGATLKQINLKDVRALKLIQPPLEIQNEFAAIVKRFDNLKTLYQQSLDQVENLYSVLSQKAFKGELDLSRIPLTPITANGQISAPLPSIQGVAVVGKAMSYPVAREKLLRRLFARFVAEKKGTAFSLEEFWPFVEQEVLDHTDENSPPLGVAEYEQAKQWLFDLLKSSGVAQHFNEESNRLELSVRA
jgi:type I restriction enzyme S subunit